MTTNDLDQARKWPAGTVDKMNEWVESQLGFFLEPWQMDLLRQMEAPLPDPLFGARATHPAWGEGIVTSHFPSKGKRLRFMFRSDKSADGTSYRWVDTSDLTFPTPDYPRSS